MLVDAHAGGIDHHQFAVETSGNRRQQPIPDTGFAPTHEPVVAGGRRPIALGDFRPRRARSKPPEDPVQHPPIIDPRHTAWLVGQQRLDDCPFPICQFVSPSRHLPLHSRRSLNHAAPANSTRFMSLRPSLALVWRFQHQGRSRQRGYLSLSCDERSTAARSCAASRSRSRPLSLDAD